MAKFEDFTIKELIPLMVEDWWWDSKCECGKRKNAAYKDKEGNPKRNRYCFDCSQAKRENGDYIDKTAKVDIPAPTMPKVDVNKDDLLDF